jgi:hypothetical protein
MAKSRFVSRNNDIGNELGQLTSRSSRRRSGTQRNNTPLWNRQQQSSSGCVKSKMRIPKSTSQRVPAGSHPTRNPGRHPARQSGITPLWSPQQQ